LLRKVDVNIFLSYANEDKESVNIVAAQLNRDDHRISNLRDPVRPGIRFMSEVVNGITAADAFLVLLSPGFLRSGWCERELGTAIQREREIQASDPDAALIRVIDLGGVAPSYAGVLAGHDWPDMGPGKMRGGVRIHRVAEGLPALLARHLHWIRAEEWL
jgi:hypothetical protein